jgi:hypothetical protein
MGITRATSGPVRCPWCARPVSDGPHSPTVCPSCGVPLARATSQPRIPPATDSPAASAGRSQRLHALSAVLCLGSVLLVMSVVFMVLSVVGQNPADDKRAQANLDAVLAKANGVYRDSGTFNGATPAVLDNKVFGVSVIDQDRQSDHPDVISMAVAGTGWYGAVRSGTGRCYAAGTVRGVPQTNRRVLPGNCTGDAARASLMPVLPGPSAPGTIAPVSASVGTGGNTGGGAGAGGSAAAAVPKSSGALQTG